jgi:hypothetical protein
MKSFQSVSVQSPEDPEDFKDETPEQNSNMWRCCLCGTSDRNCLRFSTTAILSSFIMIFSTGMIAFVDLTCPEQNTFVGLITLILGFWMKSPLD